MVASLVWHVPQCPSAPVPNRWKHLSTFSLRVNQGPAVFGVARSTVKDKEFLDPSCWTAYNGRNPSPCLSTVTVTLSPVTQRSNRARFPPHYEARNYQSQSNSKQLVSICAQSDATQHVLRTRQDRSWSALRPLQGLCRAPPNRLDLNSLCHQPDQLTTNRKPSSLLSVPEPDIRSSICHVQREPNTRGHP